MYKQFDVGEPITLYCEVKSATTSGNKWKRKTPTELESEVEDYKTEVKKAADKLKEIHGEEKYDSTRVFQRGPLVE